MRCMIIFLTKISNSVQSKHAKIHSAQIQQISIQMYPNASSPVSEYVLPASRQTQELQIHTFPEQLSKQSERERSRTVLQYQYVTCLRSRWPNRPEIGTSIETPDRSTSLQERLQDVLGHCGIQIQQPQPGSLRQVGSRIRDTSWESESESDLQSPSYPATDGRTDPERGSRLALALGLALVPFPHYKQAGERGARSAFTSSRSFTKQVAHEAI